MSDPLIKGFVARAADGMINWHSLEDAIEDAVELYTGELRTQLSERDAHIATLTAALAAAEEVRRQLTADVYERDKKIATAEAERDRHAESLRSYMQAAGVADVDITEYFKPRR